MYLTDNVMVKHCGQADRFSVVYILITYCFIIECVDLPNGKG